MKRTTLLHTTILTLTILLTQILPLAKSDPDPLQDYCISDTTTTSQTLFLNGGPPCIDPTKAHPSHFTTSALSVAGNTNANRFGFNVTLTNTKNLPGSHTQGLAMARIDIAIRGGVPPHSHPRASEITVLIRGMILVGFIDTSNRLFTQQLRPGDAFLFPRGLVHFLHNIDPLQPALAISGLNSQNPGAQVSSLATFGSNPPIPNDVLKNAFQISEQEAIKIRKNLGG